jgi:predicted RNA-binding Zn ribbon-like protein
MMLHEDWMDNESSRSPAPGRLALVQAFINTYDPEPGQEDLRAPDELRSWLAGHGLARGDEALTDADLNNTRTVREALRALLETNNGAPVDSQAIAVLNRAGDDAKLQARFDAEGRARLEPATTGIEGALGRLLAIVYTAMADDTWNRLKACRSATCRWAFYDHSKNHSAAWCTMATCGSRHKARAYRQRHRAVK